MKAITALVLALLVLVLTPVASGAKEQREAYYQEIWCSAVGGQAEVVLEDRTRVDCVTLLGAIEVDFAKKWAECIGQGLYYAISTSKLPGCLLITESPSDCKYLNRFLTVSSVTRTVVDNLGAQPLALWTAGPHDCEFGSGVHTIIAPYKSSSSSSSSTKTEEPTQHENSPAPTPPSADPDGSRLRAQSTIRGWKYLQSVGTVARRP